MSKTRVYAVVNNRIHFKCPYCQTKRMLAIPPDLRRKSLRCQKCGELSHCQFNRRMAMRQSQAGKVMMILSDGKELLVDLHDISSDGVGFELPSGMSTSISPRQEVKLRCSWNPALLDQGRYIIRNVRGRRVGVQNIMKKAS